MKFRPVHWVRDDIVLARPFSAPRVEFDFLAHDLLVLTSLQYSLMILQQQLLLQLLPAPELHPFDKRLLQQWLVDIGQECVQRFVNVHVHPLHRFWICAEIEKARVRLGSLLQSIASFVTTNVTVAVAQEKSTNITHLRHAAGVAPQGLC